MKRTSGLRSFGLLWDRPLRYGAGASRMHRRSGVFCTRSPNWPCAWPQRLLPPHPASSRSSLSRKQPRKELPYLCLLNEYIQLPYLCLLNEEDFWLSGTGHPGTGPEPAVCMGARVHFTDCPRMAMCMAVCVGSRTHFADCPRMAMCMDVCVGSRTHFADCPRMAVCMAATDTSS